MKREKFLKLLNLLSQDLKKSKSPYLNNEHWLRIIELFNTMNLIFPDHTHYFNGLKEIYKYQPGIYYISDIFEIIEYVQKLHSIDSEFEKGEKKFLQGAQDKLKEAGISFEHQDYSSTINNLNTAVELALKDELDIPLTIKKINTRKILDLCVSENIGPVNYLKELGKHILDISNKIKHTGYSPSKVDCITAIAAFEDFLKKTPKYPFSLNEATKKKIFMGI